MKMLHILGTFLAFTAIARAEYSGSPSCEPLKAEVCRGVPYNMTLLPNFVGHKKQQDAIQQLNTWTPLMMTECHPNLKFFLCSVYVPLCPHNGINSIQQSGPSMQILPCQSICEDVRKECEPQMKKVGRSWPETLQCHKFPKSNVHDHPCINVPEYVKFGNAVPGSSLNSLQTNTQFKDAIKDLVDKDVGKEVDEEINKFETLLFEKQNRRPASRYNAECSVYKKSDRYIHDKRKKICIPKCGLDIIFEKEEKENINLCIKIMASFCFILSLGTLIIFISNSSKDMLSPVSATAFANLSPAFLALAFVGYSLGYLISQIGIHNNPEWLCVEYNETYNVTALEGQRSQPCIVIFLFVYFFGSAASAWWTVVAFSWALAQFDVGKYLKPDVSTLSTITMICHIYGWGVPAILTLISILNHNIQSDELTSVCFPGALKDKDSLLWFIIIPEGVQFVLGLVMYLTGFILACCCGGQSNANDKNEQEAAKRLKILRFNFGIYGFVYMSFKVFVFISWVNEYTQRDDWLSSHNSAEPNIIWFWARIGFSFLMGILMPFWLCTTEKCPTLWKSSKQPHNPVPETYPQVSYRPQAIGENHIVMGMHHPQLPGQRRDFL